MRVLHRQAESVWRVLCTCLVVAWLAAGVTCWTGCGKPDEPGAAQPAPAGAQPPDLSAQTPGPVEGAAPAEGLETPAGEQPTAREMLGAMVAAYKKASAYDDRGYVEVQYQLQGQPLGNKMDFMAAFVRPNKIRVNAYRGLIVSDGQKLWGVVMDVPDQVLQRDAPAEITVEWLYPDHNVADAMASGPTLSYSWLPLQLILLFADDPLKTLLHGATEPELIEPAKIGQHDCHRVRIQRENGTAVFWIDQETHVLRRFEFPTDELQAMIAEGHRVQQDQIRGLSLVAELQGAQLDGQIDPQMFEFHAPEGIQMVEDFLPEDIKWLGRQVPEFSFVDLEGNAITRESLAGKIAVLDFWSTSCSACRMTLPDSEEVYQRYKDNEKIAFVAVSEDEPAVGDERLRNTFRQLGVNLPIARDPENHAFTELRVEGFPTLMIVGSDGVVEHRQTGGDQPGIGAMRMLARLEKLLAGESIHEQTFQQYQQAFENQKKQFEQLVHNCVEQDLYILTQPESAQAEILPRAEPQSLKLSPLWSSTELAAPGNVLAVERPDQPPRLLVLEEGKSIAEMSTGGAVSSVKPLSLPQDEWVFLLRSGAGADGRRYFAGTAMGVQQVHLWDEDFNLLVSFPKDALENRHAGIADARLADLDGDGTLEMAVSYFGVVGVQGASLDGTRLWADKSVIQSLRLAVLGPDAEGKRSLLCMNNRGEAPVILAIIDPKGTTTREFSVPNRSIAWLAGADLDGDGQPELCGLAPVEVGQVEAVGFNLQGEELWSYPLPQGAHQNQIESVTAGRLLPGKTGQWILAAADGTIHFLDAEGKLIDVFAYGKTLTGLAATEWDGKRVLVVSTTEGVDAWQVEPPESTLTPVDAAPKP